MQTNKVFTVLAVIAVIAFGIYYYVTTTGNANKTETYVAPTTATPTQQVETTPTPLPQPEATAKTATPASVAISNFSFNPSALTVSVGTKVTWTNNDSVPHTVTSDTGNTLGSLTLSSGQSYSHMFTQVGTFSYHCSVHPGMTGTIVVQ